MFFFGSIPLLTYMRLSTLLINLRKWRVYDTSTDLLQLTKYSAIHAWSDFNGEWGGFEIGAAFL
jgi:hypothetical protein